MKKNNKQKKNKAFKNKAMVIGNGMTNSDILTTKEAAQYLEISLKQLRNFISHKRGPKLFSKQNNRCYYKKEDLDMWNIDRRKLSSIHFLKKVDSLASRAMMMASNGKKHTIRPIINPPINWSMGMTKDSLIDAELTSFRNYIDTIHGIRNINNKPLFEEIETIFHKLWVEIEQLKQRK